MKQIFKVQGSLIAGALAGYVICALLAWTQYPGSFGPSFKWLSDLGDVTQNPQGALFYNLGIIISGVLIGLFFLGVGLWKIENHKVQNWMVRLTQGFGVLGSLAMVLSAVFPINQIDLHRVFSIALYILLGTAFAFSVAVLRYQARCPKWVLGLGVATAAADMLSGFMNESIALEWITVALFLVYLGVLSVMTERIFRRAAA